MSSRIAWPLGGLVALLIVAQWIALYRVAYAPRDTLRCRSLEVVNADGVPVCVVSASGNRGAEKVEFVMKTPAQERAVTFNVTDHGTTVELNGTAVGDRILLTANSSTGPQLSVNSNKGLVIVNPGMVMTLDPGGKTTVNSREFRVDEARGTRGVVLDLAGLRVGKDASIRTDPRR